MDRRQFIQDATFAVAVATFVRSSNQQSRSPEVGASFDSLLRVLERDPEIAKSIREGDPKERTRTERATIRTPKSGTAIASEARSMIVACEVTNPTIYSARYQSPTWPGGPSGLTIGVGYDLGYSPRIYLREDWGPYLQPEDLELLGSACGITGPSAIQYIGRVKKVRIAWQSAEAQFDDQVLPRYVGLTEAALPNTGALNGDCLGALVSLVYNRGVAFDLGGERFREMRQIKELMTYRAYDGIPQQIRSMQRLWISVPKMRGLVVRRNAEAALFARGLAALS